MGVYMARRKKRKKKKSTWSFEFITEFIAYVWTFFMEYFAWITLVAVLIGGIVAFWFFANDSRFFEVSTVTINSTRHIAKRDVMRHVDVSRGDSIFDVNIKSIANRLEEIPRIKRATVRRVLPHTIAIDIIERIEIAQIKLPFRSKYYLVDSEGVVLTPILKEARANLVTIEVTYSNKSHLVPGMVFYDEAIDAAFRLIRKYVPFFNELNERIHTVEIDHAQNMTVVLGDDLKVRVGKDENSALEKIKKIKDLFTSPDRGDVKYIDVRFNDIVVKKD